jgi:hypothetical protein
MQSILDELHLLVVGISTRVDVIDLMIHIFVADCYSRQDYHVFLQPKLFLNNLVMSGYASIFKRGPWVTIEMQVMKWKYEPVDIPLHSLQRTSLYLLPLAVGIELASTYQCSKHRLAQDSAPYKR